MAPTRALPRPTPETQHYWEGAARRRAAAPALPSLSTRPTSRRSRSVPRCTSDDIEIVRASGRGTLYSYVITERAAPGFTAPYVIAVVELEEGPRLLTNIVEIAPDPEALPLDLPVEVVFESVGEIALPMFRPSAYMTDVSSAVIVGAAETAEIGTVALSSLGLATDAARRALADCGLTPADVDGVAISGLNPYLPDARRALARYRHTLGRRHDDGRLLQPHPPPSRGGCDRDRPVRRRPHRARRERPLAHRGSRSSGPGPTRGKASSSCRTEPSVR